MAKLVVLFLLCICVVHASKRHFILRNNEDGAINITENLSSRARNLGKKALNFTEVNSDEMIYSFRVGGSDVGPVSNMLAVLNKDMNYQKMGIAAAYNKFWIIAATKIWPANGPDNSDVRVYGNIADVTNYQSGKIYKVKEKMYHPDVNSIMLIRICPDMTSFLPLPSSGETFPEATPGEFYNFMPNKLQKGTKNTAAGCECESLYGWDENKQICMQESNTMYNAANEEGSLLVINNKLAGINAESSSATGESYWSMEKYEGWISSNTPY